MRYDINGNEFCCLLRVTGHGETEIEVIRAQNVRHHARCRLLMRRLAMELMVRVRELTRWYVTHVGINATY